MRGNYDFSSFSKGDPPMTEWGKAQFNAAKPSQGPRGVKLSETNDMVYKCVPPGMPYIYLQLFPMQIMQTPKEVIELFESDHTVRHIFIDGRKHPDDLTPTYNGHSIGHWEGDTLVVETAGFNDKTPFDAMGRPHGERLRVTERYHRRDFGRLDIEMTFDDPQFYTRPFTIKVPHNLMADSDVFEAFCFENEKDRIHLGK